MTLYQAKIQALERRNDNDIDEPWLNLELSLQHERENHTKFFRFTLNNRNIFIYNTRM